MHLAWDVGWQDIRITLGCVGSAQGEVGGSRSSSIGYKCWSNWQPGSVPEQGRQVFHLRLQTLRTLGPIHNPI
jgi:hypothetical protein